MKFLCDVHISYKLIKYLSDSGFQAVHVNNILQGSNTKDYKISQYVDEKDFILITKDQDFKNTFHLMQTPKKLIKINLGNISNEKLIDVFKNNIDLIRKANINSRYLTEVDKNAVMYTTYR